MPDGAVFSASNTIKFDFQYYLFVGFFIKMLLIINCQAKVKRKAQRQSKHQKCIKIAFK